MKAYAITIGVIVLLLGCVVLAGKYGMSDVEYEKQESEAAKLMEQQQIWNQYKADHPEEFKDPAYDLAN